MTQGKGEGSKKWVGLRANVPFSTKSNKPQRHNKTKERVFRLLRAASCGEAVHGRDGWEVRAS